MHFGALRHVHNSHNDEVATRPATAFPQDEISWRIASAYKNDDGSYDDFGAPTFAQGADYPRNNISFSEWCMVPSGVVQTGIANYTIEYQLHLYKNNINAAANISKGWDGGVLYLTTADGFVPTETLHSLLSRARSLCTAVRTRSPDTPPPMRLSTDRCVIQEASLAYSDTYGGSKIFGETLYLTIPNEGAPCAYSALCCRAACAVASRLRQTATAERDSQLLRRARGFAQASATRLPTPGARSTSRARLSARARSS